MLAVLVETRQAGREEARAGPVGRIKTHHLHLEQGEEKFTPCQRSQGPGGCRYGAGQSRAWVNAGQGWNMSRTRAGSPWRRPVDRRGHESSVGQDCCFDGGQLKKLLLSQALVEPGWLGGGVFEDLGGDQLGRAQPSLPACCPQPTRPEQMLLGRFQDSLEISLCGTHVWTARKAGGE